MTYAVSVCDLLAVSKRDPILHMLVAPHMDRDHVVEAERGKVAGIGHAAVLACPEEQAAAIVALAAAGYALFIAPPTDVDEVIQAVQEGRLQ